MTGNIDEILREPIKNRIRLVGVELEGGWDSRKLKDPLNVIRDGSVHLDNPDRYLMIGELPGPAMPWSEAEPWVRKYYPHVTNHTCGMHVHMSFANALTYQLLMTEDYQDTVLEYLKRWADAAALFPHHPIYSRLRGESGYCQKNFWADIQARASRKEYDRNAPGNRYTVINYCYARHSTIECRVLPMFENVDLAVAAIGELLKITNAFLRLVNQKEELTIDAAFLATDDSPFEERVIVCV